MIKRIAFVSLFIFFYYSPVLAQLTIDLVKGNTSAYSIVLSSDATKAEKKAAELLQSCIQKTTNAHLPILTESPDVQEAIYIGNTDRFAAPKTLKDESYILKAEKQDIIICGRNGGGVIYGVCAFLEKYVDCRKLDAGPVFIQPKSDIIVPLPLNEVSEPLVVYREAYFPPSKTTEYLQWHGLHQYEDLWGIWGHSFERLVPSSNYFKDHPEYFALVGGQRQPSQLCLSNEQVFKIAVAKLKETMARRPDALYWSIAPNDQFGYCHCQYCSEVDKEEGSPSGSLIRFVNRIAQTFPDKNFTTLAYTYTLKPPVKTKPAANVYIFVSNIDAYRNQPLEKEPSAAAFVKNLKQWAAITKNIFVWDYATQFTNYLAPFPDIHTLQDNFRLYKANNVKGIFAQGSGETYSDFAELRSYIYAKLLWNVNTNVEAETASFIKDYYGPAAPFVSNYLSTITKELLKSKRRLDIYGTPINEWDAYLSPQLLISYQSLLKQAEQSTKAASVYRERVKRLQLSLEYVVLQQARFYGTEQGGIYTLSGDSYIVNKTWPDRVKTFAENAKNAGVIELSEDGLSPEAYQQEWQKIFNTPKPKNKAFRAKVKLLTPYSPDYPAKGARTLVDGANGYADYSYNWLFFYGTPLAAEIELPEPVEMTQISIGFLQDLRHWIYAPDQVEVSVSAEGDNYQSGTISNTVEQLSKTVTKTICTSQFPETKVKFIKIKASLTNYAIPESTRKRAIAVDELLSR